MAPTKPPKKNGTIEIRLPDEAKAAFMERCRQRELTASEAIRTFIDEQVSPCPSVRQRSMPYWRIAVAGAVGAVLGISVAAPSLARSTQNTHLVFEQLDHNHDGVLSYQEFHQR
jgi:hypothetical protein